MIYRERDYKYTGHFLRISDSTYSFVQFCSFIHQPESVKKYIFSLDMERLQSQLALAAFLQELGEAVEEAELVCFVIV